STPPSITPTCRTPWSTWCGRSPRRTRCCASASRPWRSGWAWSTRSPRSTCLTKATSSPAPTAADAGPSPGEIHDLIRRVELGERRARGLPHAEPEDRPQDGGRRQAVAGVVAERLVDEPERRRRVAHVHHDTDAPAPHLPQGRGQQAQEVP